jgi:hypothetical protein
MSGCTGHYLTCRCGPCVHARQFSATAVARFVNPPIGRNIVGHVVSCRCAVCLRAEQVFNSTFEEFGCQ